MDNKKGATVSLVVQRYRSCKLLLNEKEWVRQGVPFNNDDGVTSHTVLQVGVDDDPPSTYPAHCGLLLYVSFAANADPNTVRVAAETILNLPVLTLGLWGDGVSQQYSVKQLLNQRHNTKAHHCDNRNHPCTSITIVPQANLICKVKSQGQSIQYHGQIDKSKGEQLYDYFVNCICGAIFELQYEQASEATDSSKMVLPDWFVTWKNQQDSQQTTMTPTATTSSLSSQPVDPSIPPTELFQNGSIYGSIDGISGIPTTYANGQPLTKSAMKKLQKVMDAHTKRYNKWMLKSNVPLGNDDNSSSKEENIPTTDAEVVVLTGATTRLPHTQPEKLEAGGTLEYACTEVVQSKTTTLAEMELAPVPTATTNSSDSTSASLLHQFDWDAVIDPSFCKIVAGTFGRRQGLEFESDMGPFCHLINL